MIDELMISEGTAVDTYIEYRNLCELGGFDASGPRSVADLIARVGAGEYRVSTYGFEPRGLRWEVLVRHTARRRVGCRHGSCGSCCKIDLAGTGA